MNEIWINRLIEGTKQWSDVPESRKNTLKALLRERVDEETFGRIVFK